MISKENFSNLHDGFLIAGMDENGNLIYADLNGDGLINVDDVSVNTDSRILTLSTCMTGQDDKRFLVEAVLISEED